MYGPTPKISWISSSPGPEPLDGVQTSTRYPGGVALRFARVKQYRVDKDPQLADTIATVQAMR